MPCFKQTESFCLASINCSWNEIFYLLRILTIVAKVFTVMHSGIGGKNVTFFFFFLQEAVGNCCFKGYNYNIQRTRLWGVFSPVPGSTSIHVSKFHKKHQETVCRLSCLSSECPKHCPILEELAKSLYCAGLRGIWWCFVFFEVSRIFAN